MWFLFVSPALVLSVAAASPEAPSTADAVAAQAVAATTAAPEPPYYQDVEPANCVLGYNCTDGGMPVYRGICVQAKNPGAGRACWDVCNPNHAPAAYNSSEVYNPVLLASTTGMIQAVRANLNPIVTCPNLLGGDPCKPGEMCGADFLTAFAVPEGRGICVLDDTQARDRGCWDMCDHRKNAVDYTMGTASGTESKIMDVRGSSACPGLQWWQILLIVLVVLLVLACLAGVGYVVMFGKGRGKSHPALLKQKHGGLEAEPRDYQEEYPEMQGGQMMEAGGMDGGSFGDDHQAQHYRGQQGGGFSEDMMAPPPSPPRQGHSQSREVFLEEAYGPPPQEPPRGYYAEQGPVSPPEQQYQHHPQQQQQYYAPDPQPLQEPVESSFYPSGAPSASMMGTTSGLRIPGLDEPNLLGHVGQMMHQQVPTLPQSPALLSSSSNPLGSFNFAPGQQASLQQPVMPSFHTQLPPMYGQQTPPASVQLQQPGSQQWFTQLQRR